MSREFAHLIASVDSCWVNKSTLIRVDERRGKRVELAEAQNICGTLDQEPLEEAWYDVRCIRTRQRACGCCQLLSRVTPLGYENANSFFQCGRYAPAPWRSRTSVRFPVSLE